MHSLRATLLGTLLAAFALHASVPLPPDNLGFPGRYQQTRDGGFELVYFDGTKLVVTPQGELGSAQGGDPERRASDSAGRLKSIGNFDGRNFLSLSYDSRGRLSRISKSGKSISLRYGNDKRLSQVIFPSREKIDIVLE